MKFGRIRSGGKLRTVAVAEDSEIARDVTAVGMATLDWVRLPASQRNELFQAVPEIAIEQADWLPPIANPNKILCVGLNYADHARETDSAPPSEPLIFNKLTTTLTAHQSVVPLPIVSNQVDFEAELVVVIGEGGRYIQPDQALQHVAGYMCGNDVSARDWQKEKPGRQWLLGKSFDGFAPTGPWIVPADEIDPSQLNIELRLNGKTMQQSTTANLIFPVELLVSYVSQVCLLLPGDLLFTGTPAGVGMARDPQVFLQPGDLTEVTIEGLGTLTNRYAEE